MKQKNIIILLSILFLIGFLFFIFINKPKYTEKDIGLNNKNGDNFLLAGFPVDKIPLYKQTKISSSKIFVNTDPKNTSTFGDKNFAYYNVVFYSEASREEFLNYYKNLFEEQIVEEYKSPDMVKGTIGEYKVSAAHYGSDGTGYIQVHLPDFKDQKNDKYFVEFPDVIETNDLFIEHEKSYGLLNQKGGEIEYTKYFSVINSGDQDNDGKDDVDEFLVLEQQFRDQYKNELNYQFDEKSKLLKWNQNDYENSLAITPNHGRIYLTLRKGLNK